jgi:uncharacterized protein
MYIDVYTHVIPQKYLEALQKKAAAGKIASKYVDGIGAIPSIANVFERLRVMEKFPDIQQVLTITGPQLESIAQPSDSVELAKICNDEMAEIVQKYPEKFVAAAALMPYNDIDACLKEIDRAVKDLGLRGILITSNIAGKPLDSPELMPIYQKMEQYDLPIFIHPIKDASEPDYHGEQGSKYNLAAIVGWPHATTMAMMRIAGSGVLEKCPKLKFITHHAGGTVPYLAKRIEMGPYKYEGLQNPVIDSLRKFYGDTAVQGNTPNLMAAYALFGAEHMLFGTDFPYAKPELIEATVKSVEWMQITPAERKLIFSENAKRLLNLK